MSSAGTVAMPGPTGNLESSTITVEAVPTSDSMFEFGLEPGLNTPYDITKMIQWEPGTIGMKP